MNQEFILTITEHRYLGWIVAAYHMTQDNEAFITIDEQLSAFHLDKEGYDFTENQASILKAIDKYTEHNLALLFTRRQTATEFFSNISLDRFNEDVRPVIEERLYKVVQLAYFEKVPIYIKKPNYNNLYESDRLEYNCENADAVFHFNRSPEKFSYYLSINRDGKKVSLLNKEIIVLSNSPCVVVLDNNLYCFKDIDAKKLKPFTAKQNITIPKTAEKKYFETFVLNCVKNNVCEVEGFEVVNLRPRSRCFAFLEEDLSGNPVLTLKFKYGNRYFLYSGEHQHDVSFEDNDGDFRFLRFQRDLEWENAKVNFLLSSGLTQSQKSWFSIPEYKDLHSFIVWINAHSDEFDREHIRIKQNFHKTQYFVGKTQLTTGMDDKPDWFELYGIVHFGEFKIPFIQLKKHILTGSREYVLPNGDVAILPEEWFQRYQDIFKFGKEDDDTLKLDKIHFNLLQNHDTTEANRALIQDVYSHQVDKNIDVPKYVNATLRSYQQEGYSWMYHLNKNNFGGCLADDMGLGKTLQTLTLLQKVYEDTWEYEDVENSDGTTTKKPKFPVSKDIQPEQASLIVMPKSLLHNWQNEIKKFCPHLLVYLYTGTKRFRTKDIGNVFRHFNIILTSYGLVRNDLEFLENYYFKYLILDESHYIKNPSSKAYQAVNKIKAERRLALTGTPIENSLQDLWAQFNFINKGLLGSMSYFKNHFVVPITKHNDEKREERLQKIIQPFILRRAKHEVAKDLPPLTEQVLYCDMSEDQKKSYEKEKSGIRSTILQNLESVGVDKTRMMALQGLMRLRQMANHPVLVEPDYKSDSGKFDRVIQNLKNLVAENHKVLVFSSFVKHLRLIEHYLIKTKTKYSILTGETSNREAVIDDFQKNEDNMVFLISLKAGGVGLNLTSADYVFILDPWWNPQAEMQAINRAHRIGQDKKVMVYRFISKDTIEEKITLLQQRKSELASTFINSNNPFRELTEKEIEELFR